MLICTLNAQVVFEIFKVQKQLSGGRKKGYGTQNTNGRNSLGCQGVQPHSNDGSALGGFGQGCQGAEGDRCRKVAEDLPNVPFQNQPQSCHEAGREVLFCQPAPSGHGGGTRSASRGICGGWQRRVRQGEGAR